MNTGVAEDTRTPEQKQKDWTHEELVGQGAYVWKEDWNIPMYTHRNQDGSFECGGFSLAKALGRNNEKEFGFQDLNPNFIYRLRSNQGDGMFMQNMFDIARKYGAPLDTSLLCDNLSQGQLNAKPAFTDGEFNVALKFRSSNYLFIDKNNIDGIAQSISDGYTPILLLRAGLKEWTSSPKIDPGTTDFNLVHFVPLIHATLKDGVKTFVCDDSFGWSGGENGLRYLSEDFIKGRGVQVGYCLDLPTNDPYKPNYHFTAPITYGMNNGDVIALQRVLVYEGFMPAPKQFGYFLSITARALQKWQIKHSIMDYANETDLTKIRCGQKSLSVLNSIYNI